MKYIQLYEEKECKCMEKNFGPDPLCSKCGGEGYTVRKSNKISIKEFAKLMDEELGKLLKERRKEDK